jgi:hypothetical protein
VICVAWGALLMYPCHCSTRHADLTCALCSRERDSLRQLDSAGPRSRPIVPDSGDDMHVEFDLSPDFPKLPPGVSPEYAGMMHAALSETPSERPSFGQVHTTLISLHAAAVAAESAAVGVSPAAQVRRPALMCAHGARGPGRHMVRAVRPGCGVCRRGTELTGSPLCKLRCHQVVSRHMHSDAEGPEQLGSS